MKTLTCLASITFLFASFSCSSPDGGGETDTSVDTTAPDTGNPPIPYDRPDWMPAVDEDAGQTTILTGLTGPVRVVHDNRGIPHIYGENVLDVAQVQGYVTAQKRLFQMHVLRSAVKGHLAGISGSGALRGDVLLRTLKLHEVAKKMSERTKTQAPDLYAALEAFSAGVNAYIDQVNGGTAPLPLEIKLFGLQLDPWTPIDTLCIVRLQTWDLGFEGYLDKNEILAIALELKEKFENTPLSGIWDDALSFAPPTQTAIIQQPAGKPGIGKKPTTLSTVLSNPFYRQFKVSTLKRLARIGREMRDIPHHAFRSEDFGSNNWVISGSKTASGRAIVANDTHLSLRNPPVFFHVHLNTVLAGGDYEVSGVNFAGAPGIVLGNNRHAAWGATVFFSDVTDTYVEELTADGGGVMFKGQEVALDVRNETFDYYIAGDGTCQGAVTGWLNNLDPKIESLGEGSCRLTVTIKEVPHHGPIIPWSYDITKDGKPIVMSWRWTGFEATDELNAIWDLNSAKTVDDFRTALDKFGVGAQNWVFGDAEGNIAWYPSHLLPNRPHIAEQGALYPPYLPVPGDGCCEWDGFVDRAKLPQSTNPEKGYLVTANSDPTGVSFDGDPLNDGLYFGFFWDAGFRMERASERVAAAVEKGGITRADMGAIQADHRSNLGVRITPHLLAAVKAAQSGDDAAAQALLTPNVSDAVAYLEGWTFEAASGVDSAADSQDAKDSIATAIFNAFLVHLVQNTLADEGLADMTDQLKVRLLLRMLETPEQMATLNPETQQSRIWDNVETTDVAETRNVVLVKSLVDALAFLSNPEKVGIPQDGGFGTDDMTEWRWGKLHTVTLKHNVTTTFSIPPSTDPTNPNGFPRPGDNFTVDACHPGMGDTNFTYTHGPAIRNVYEPGTELPQWGVIPGGQDENPTSAHYSDEMAHWVVNNSPPVPFAVTDVLAAKESIADFIPPSAVKSE